MDRPLWFKYIIILAFLVIPNSVFAAASINVYEVNTNNNKVSDYDEIYVREDAVIEISFTYDSDSSSEVNGWEIWIGAENSGTLFDSGDFSNSKATVSFTTEDIAQKSSGSISGVTLGQSPNYDYTITVALDYTNNSSSTTTTDGDSDDTVDGDDEINDEPSQALTIRVDMDPPAAMTLLEDPVPGEQSVTVSWEPEILSETGEEEENVTVQFCVVSLNGSDDAQTTTDGDTETTTSALVSGSFNNLLYLKVDGDEDTEVASEVDQDEDIVDGDDDTVVADGDEDIAEVDDEEVTDGDDVVTDGDDVVTDGDDVVTDGDDVVTDGDDVVTDGDTTENTIDGDYEASESEVTYDECLTPIPETTNSETYRITGLLNGVTYKIRAVAIDAAGNVGLEWSNEITGTPQEVDDFWEAYKNSGGKEDGGFCFIATAAYGSYSHEDVQLLRTFRDKVLMHSVLGRKIVTFYYKTSPPLAKLVAKHPAFAFFVRVLLYPVILLLGFMFKLSALAQIGIVCLALFASAGLMYFVRRVRHQEVS